MSDANYKSSEKTQKQRRDAARKTGENATTSDDMDGVVLAESFAPFCDVEDDPAVAFEETLTALENGDPAPYTEIEAALLTLIRTNAHAMCVNGPVLETENGHHALNLQLIANEKLTSSVKSLRSARGQFKPKKAKRAATAMRKKLAEKHAQRTMVH